LIFLVVGDHALTVRSNINRRKALTSRTLQAQKESVKAVVSTSIYNSVDDFKASDIINIAMGNMCIIVSVEFAKQIEEFKKAADATPLGELPEERGVTELEVTSKVTSKVGTHIAVIDDILAVLSLIAAVVKTVNAIKEFYAGLPEDKIKEMDDWQRQANMALTVAKTKMDEYQKEFTDSGYTNSAVTVQLGLLKDQIQTMQSKIRSILLNLQHAERTSKWKLNGVGIGALFYTFGINYIFVSAGARAEVNEHQNKAYCASKSLPDEITTLTVVLAAVYDSFAKISRSEIKKSIASLSSTPPSRF